MKLTHIFALTENLEGTIINAPGPWNLDKLKPDLRMTFKNGIFSRKMGPISKVILIGRCLEK